MTNSPPFKRRQVLAAGVDGCLYLIDQFAVSLWAIVGNEITSLHTLPAPATLGVGAGGTVQAAALDAAVCAGHFCELRVFHDGRRIACVTLSDWPRAVSVCSDGGPAAATTTVPFGATATTRLVVGAEDGTVAIVNASVTWQQAQQSVDEGSNSEARPPKRAKLV